MQFERLRSPARLCAGALSLAVALVFAVVAFRGPVAAPRLREPIALSADALLPNPFVPLITALRTNQSPLAATLVPVRTPDFSFHVYYGDFAGTDTELVTAESVSLMRVPDNGTIVPARVAMTSLDIAANPPDYFGYRYTQNALLERQRSTLPIPFKERFPGEFYLSTLAYLRHKDTFDAFAEKNGIVWMNDIDVLQMPGRLHMVVPGDEAKGLSMRARNFPQICGDGAIIGSEQCDDGSTADGDGCSQSCAVEASWACNGQPSKCYQPHTCGNGVLEVTEECDDANTVSGDACGPTCKKESCGDGVFQPERAEQCDDGNKDENDTCRSDCTLLVPF